MDKEAVQEAETFFSLGDQEVVRALQEGYREGWLPQAR